jgi:hypothetical protein
MLRVKYLSKTVMISNITNNNHLWPILVKVIPETYLVKVIPETYLVKVIPETYPGQGYSRNVPGQGYSRNVSWSRLRNIYIRYIWMLRVKYLSKTVMISNITNNNHLWPNLIEHKSTTTYDDETYLVKVIPETYLVKVIPETYPGQGYSRNISCLLN